MVAQFSVLALDALLLATLVYLFMLMRRLKIFNTYQHDMRTIVSDVITATESARSAVIKLKSSVFESQNSMAQYFEDARQLEKNIDQKIEVASRILNDLQKFQSRQQAQGEVRNSAKSNIEPSRTTRQNVLRNAHANAAWPVDEALQSQHKVTEVEDVDQIGDLEVHRRLDLVSKSVRQLRSKITASS